MSEDRRKIKKLVDDYEDDLIDCYQNVLDQKGRFMVVGICRVSPGSKCYGKE